ncbi:hypothetical protein ABPG75_010143 [Micractinium tetrahymenae]
MDPQQLQELFAFADSYRPPEYQLPVRLQPFLPDYVPAIGAPNAFIAPPRPDGEPDFLGLTVLDEPALRQSDPAAVALQLRHQLRLQGGGGSSSSGGAGGEGGLPPLGWVADPARQPQGLDDWIQQVEGLHQEAASAATLAPAPPDLERLMQAWSPEVQAQLQGSALPDPRQDVDVHTFARMVLAVLDLAPPANAGAAGGSAGSAAAGLAEALHSLFALYLEFRNNPAFQQLGVFGPAAATLADAAAEHDSAAVQPSLV